MGLEIQEKRPPVNQCPIRAGKNKLASEIGCKKILLEKYQKF
jgi:hypothetical protein